MIEKYKVRSEHEINLCEHKKAYVVVWKNVPPRIIGVDVIQVYPCCSGNL